MTDAIVARGLRKEFRYLNPESGMASSDQWLDYLVSFATGKKANASGVERRKVVAVDSLDMTVHEGEFFGLLGPNGAGKTTSIKLLSTVLSPTAGAATINGYDLVSQPEQVKSSINVVRSGGWLGFDHLVSIRWNLEIWARIYGMTRKQAKDKTDEILDLVGLQDKAGESSGTLSSGQRQRLALAKGLLVRTPILLCDEPTVALDPGAARAVREFIKNDLNRRHGQTVVLTTHYMQEAEQLCDRVAIMEGGRIIACDTPERLRDRLPARVVVCAVTSLTLDGLAALKRDHGDWQVTERLDQAGDGSVRVLMPSATETAALTGSLRAAGAVVGSVADEPKTLEDVFVALTGKGLAA